VLEEGVDEISKVTFTTLTKPVTGVEEIEVVIDPGSSNVFPLTFPIVFGYGTTRFWGNIHTWKELKEDLYQVEAYSKLWQLKNEKVPYTEIAFTAKRGDFIAQQLLLEHTDWCDTSELDELEVIPFKHFVDVDILTALAELCELLGMIYVWEPDTHYFRIIAPGALESVTLIDTKYINDEAWIEDSTDVINRVFVKGGRIDDDEEEPFITKFAWDGASALKYGTRDYTYADEAITNEETAQKLADGYLALHKDPIRTGEANDVPFDPVLRIGELVEVRQTKYDGVYVVQEIHANLATMTMDVRFTSVPRGLSYEIRDMQRELGRVKRNALKMYEKGKPILVRTEMLRRASDIAPSVSAIFGLALDFQIPAELGGLSIGPDTIHRRKEA